MTPKQVTDYFGNENKAALELGLSAQAVRLWKASSRPEKYKIPRMTQHAIAHITNDALKVDEK